MKINVWWVVALAVVLFAVMRSCEKKPKVVTVTTTDVNIEKIKDVVDEVELEEKHNLIWEELTKSQEFIKKLLPKKTEWDDKISYDYIYYPFNFFLEEIIPVVSTGKTCKNSDQMCCSQTWALINH